MRRGKVLCKTLKSIRKEVAKANDIDYTPVECHHTGPCRGTCPACEAEVRYLEQQLSLRRKLGKAVAVAGIAMSALNVQAQSTEPATITPLPTPQDDTLQKEIPVKSMLREGEEGIVWRGRVIDEYGDPCIGASILRTDIIPKSREMSAVTDIDGRFAVEIPVGAELTFFYVGMKDTVLKVDKENPSQVQVVMSEDVTTGLVVIAGGVSSKMSYDDVYGRCRKKGY